jgi:hypothetical protein
VSQTRAGLVAVAANATDTLLTMNASSPVTTAMPFTVIVPFTDPTRPVGRISPIGALVRSAWLQQKVASRLTYLPSAADYKSAYETVLGSALPDADYYARTYAPGSGAALTVFASDVIVSSLPSLGGVFITSVLPPASPAQVVSTQNLERGRLRVHYSKLQAAVEHGCAGAAVSTN